MNETKIKLDLDDCYDDEIDDLIFQIIDNPEFGRMIEVLSKTSFKTPVEFYTNPSGLTAENNVLNSFSEYTSDRLDIQDRQCSTLEGLYAVVDDFIFSPENDQILKNGTTIKFLCEKLIFDMTLVHLVSATVFLFNAKYIKRKNQLLDDNRYDLKIGLPSVDDLGAIDIFVDFSNSFDKIDESKYSLEFCSSNNNDATTVVVNMKRYDDTLNQWVTEWEISHNIKDRSLPTNLVMNTKRVLDDYYKQCK